MRFRSSISTLPGSISGSCQRSCSPPGSASENDGPGSCSGCWIEGKVEQVVQAWRRFPPPSPELADLLHKEAEYFDPAGRDHRMRYPQFRAQGLFVGSGVVEAGCKTVIAARLKRSGMFWTVRGANAILALRCCRLSQRFGDYWESRPRAA